MSKNSISAGAMEFEVNILKSFLKLSESVLEEEKRKVVKTFKIQVGQISLPLKLLKLEYFINFESLPRCFKTKRLESSLSKAVFPNLAPRSIVGCAAKELKLY